MEKLLIFLMILVSTFVIWVKDIEISVMDRSYRTIQYGLEHAVHDAALQVKPIPLAEGNIVFDQMKSEDTMYQSLQQNLPIDSMLHPTSNVFIEQPLKVRDIVYLDDEYIDPLTGLNLQFPFVWEHTLSDGFSFERSVFGPSVALVVDVQVKGADKEHPFVVIQEYKD